ncbi:MAG: hypothetical protein GY859_07880 [Desulfobacterales bacterium]|nr:hypothetical protein [Desulfobacterales bacterium]
MTVEEYIETPGYLLFRDESLRRHACKSVERFFAHYSPVDNVQFHSIPVVIQAGGLGTLRQLIENQKKKNTKEINRKFWEFLSEQVEAGPVRETAFRTAVQEEMARQGGLLEDESKAVEKVEKKKVRRKNKARVEKVMDHALAVYFEHFNCHYFYTKAQGAAK